MSNRGSGRVCSSLDFSLSLFSFQTFFQSSYYTYIPFHVSCYVFHVRSTVPSLIQSSLLDSTYDRLGVMVLSRDSLMPLLTKLRLYRFTIKGEILAASLFGENEKRESLCFEDTPVAVTGNIISARCWCYYWDSLVFFGQYRYAKQYNARMFSPIFVLFVSGLAILSRVSQFHGMFVQLNGLFFVHNFH